MTNKSAELRQLLLRPGKPVLSEFLWVGGAGGLEVAPGVQSIDAPGFPEWIKPGSRATSDALEQLQKLPELDWSFLAPSAKLEPGPIVVLPFANLGGDPKQEPPSRQGRLFPAVLREPMISLCALRGSLLCRPVELGPVDPHAVQNDRELARDGDFGLAEPVALSQPNPPGLQGRPFLYASEQHIGGFEQIADDQSACEQALAEVQRVFFQ